ncbi:MAG: phosphoethanolamine transferase [Dysgonamonadaceae bacterium]|jgi:glucan phosphoethanolaminetransferase (alkaline phosphatase superfamily)|nr:phosphoethanolamine transferase [Dysgonamonadaceae bacterium]
MNKDNKDFLFVHNKHRKWILILSIIVLLPNIYLAFYDSDIGGSSSWKIAIYLIASIFLFILPSLFLKARNFFIVQGIFVILAPFEIAHIYLNRMPATMAFLLSIIDTEWNESTEMLSSLRLPILFLLLVWAFYFYVVFKKIRNRYFIRSKKIRAYISAFYIVFVLTGYSYYFTKMYPQNTHTVDTFKAANEEVLLKFQKIYPYDLIIRVYQVYDTKNSIKDGCEKIKSFRFGAEKKETVAEREVYVFVIGETGRYNSYALNGYERNTSPLLSKTPDLISYSDCFSEANITTSSLSILLTRASAVDYKRSYIEKSFVDAFQEAGFSTYWIANQSANNNFVQRIAEDATGEYFTTLSLSDENYDEKLWSFLEEVLKKDEKKVFIVLHTLGSHFRYNFRYPGEFEVFQPCLEGAFDYNLISPKNKQQFINSYDNSILYTDYFLANTIQKIDSLNAVSTLIYMADHGENLFDTDDNIIFHGGGKYTEYDFHVPLFIWTSGKYKSQYPQKAENMLHNKDKKLSASAIFYSWLDIADISFPEQKLTKSIASEFLKIDSARYVVDTNLEVKRLNF